MTDLIAFIEAMDRCWMERRFDDLSDFMADGVVIVAPDGEQRAVGLVDAIESYRKFMSRNLVSRFETKDYAVTAQHDTAIVEYGWLMGWSSGGETYDAEGREVLVLSRSAGDYRVIWRMQIAG